MALLEVQHISKHIQDNVIIDDISFQQQALQKIAVAGESGAGKTTLLKIISGHGQADSGIVLFDGKKVKGSEEQLLPGHKQVGYLTQEHDLLHNYVVEDLVWFENELSKEEAMKLFEICQIDHLLKRRTDRLSGGEKQRIALCMLLIKQPKLLVLDEPFSNLDPIHTDTFKNVLDDITERLKITCILTSHDPHDTLSWADEILVMKNGKLVQQGTPQELYHKPVNEYVAGLFGKYNVLSAEQAALFGIRANGATVMLRPEEFVISTNEGMQGAIQKISFWGSFYEVEVLAENLKIVVRVMRNEWKVGEEVFVKII